MRNEFNLGCAGKNDSSNSHVANTMNSCPRVTAVVLNWNAASITVQCLESLRGAAYPRLEVVVVDNASTDDSLETMRAWGTTQAIPDAVRQHFGRSDIWRCVVASALRSAPELLSENPRIILLRTRENLGFAEGSNVGIAYALSCRQPADYVFLLNNDAQVDRDCISACVEVARDTQAGIMGALVKSVSNQVVPFAGSRFPRGLFWAHRMPLPNAGVIQRAVDSVSGCAMLLRRDMLLSRRQTCGHYLDPELFMYFEDTELCVWARRSGYPVRLTGKGVVHHHGALSTGGGGSALSYYYLTRNRIHLARRLLSWQMRLLFHLWYVPTRLLRTGQRALQGKPVVSRAILAGIWDGYRGITGKWRKHAN